MPELGWALAEHVHGKGYAREGLRAIIAWGDKQFGSLCTACIIHRDNHRSFRVADELGFRAMPPATSAEEVDVILSRPPRSRGSTRDRSRALWDFSSSTPDSSRAGSRCRQRRCWFAVIICQQSGPPFGELNSAVAGFCGHERKKRSHWFNPREYSLRYERSWYTLWIARASSRPFHPGNLCSQHHEHGPCPRAPAVIARARYHHNSCDGIVKTKSP
jgi:hypothetical protein